MVRDFRRDPVTAKELMDCYWYSVVDDITGGYAITTVNEPVSQINPYEGMFEVGNFMNKDITEHLVHIHNAWYQQKVFIENYSENVNFSIHKRYEEAYLLTELTEDDWFDYSDDYEASRELD